MTEPAETKSSPAEAAATDRASADTAAIGCASAKAAGTSCAVEASDARCDAEAAGANCAPAEAAGANCAPAEAAATACTSAEAAAANHPVAELRPNQRTRRVMVGGVPMGGGAPVAVQSMLNAPADDVAANLAQIDALAQAGCEIVRMAIPRRACLDAFAAVCEASPLPVVADVHFDPVIAIEAARRGAAKLRINPGNIGGLAATDAVLDAAGEAGIPIRIGVNAGSLDQELASRTDLTLPQKLAASAAQYVAYCESRGFSDLVVSAKAHDVMTTVRTYRQLATDIPHVPLHIGVTEAGTAFQGTIKSAAGLGILLEEGIGDTMRISLTDDPAVEVRACWTLLSALDLRRRNPELISCPTCGRCQVNLIDLAKQVEARLSGVASPVKVAVMGCVVNGPGEAADADIGVACGAGSGIVFRNGETIRKVAEDQIVDALMEEIENL